MSFQRDHHICFAPCLRGELSARGGHRVRCPAVSMADDPLSGFKCLIIFRRIRDVQLFDEKAAQAAYQAWRHSPTSESLLSFASTVTPLFNALLARSRLWSYRSSQVLISIISGVAPPWGLSLALATQFYFCNSMGPVPKVRHARLENPKFVFVLNTYKVERW